jgi:hypothetical protein
VLVGLDFDNTIVCYDKAIATLAEELLNIPPDLPRTKLALRGFLRQANRESEWTAFQGALYGPGMAFAEPFEQALETLGELKNSGCSFCVVSHRSPRPYSGPAYDLHAAARGWVERWLESTGLVENKAVFFHNTREQKIAAIAALQCNLFLDDLPEVIEDPGFPRSCRAILFDPDGSHTDSGHIRVRSWSKFLPCVLASLK